MATHSNLNFPQFLESEGVDFDDTVFDVLEVLVLNHEDLAEWKLEAVQKLITLRFFYAEFFKKSKTKQK